MASPPALLDGSLDSASHAATPSSPAPLAGPAAVRVLHVINGEHYSGAERVQDLLGGYLPACGYEVGFACVKPGRFPTARRFPNVRLDELPMRGRFDRSAGPRLAQLVRDEKYALLHAHTPRSLMVAADAARRADVPLIYHVHSPAGRDSTRRLQNWVNAWLERRWALQSSRLIAVSPSVGDYMRDRGFPERQVVCVPNGVPKIETPTRRAASTVWTLGMTALFRPRKGVEVLLEALAMVRERRSNVRLRAIGPFETAEYEASVRALAARLELDDAIDWTGFTTDVVAELAQIDVLVLPSLFGEGLPMVVLEALAAGIPVIASRVEGVPLAVREGQEGLLVEPASASDLASAIERLVDGQLDYPAMSRAAQACHAAQFSAEVMARRVADIYDAVLGR